MRVVFMGTPAFAVPSLEAVVRAGHDVALVVTREDKPRGRSAELAAPEVKLEALRYGLTVLQPKSVRTPESIEAIRRAEPEVLVVVAYGRILPVELLRAAPRGGVNVHASLLPLYRGAAPVSWAIACGETETGVTTMQMDEGLDTGSILLSRRAPIGPRETAPELSARLAAMGAELLVETLDGLDHGTIDPRPQDGSRATQAPMLRKEDGIIDWSWSATVVDGRVRGFQPWPGCHTTFRGKPLVVHSGEPAADEVKAPPGTVGALGREGLPVTCGAGTYVLREVTPFGRRRMSARDFANGARIAAGERMERPRRAAPPRPTKARR